MSDALVRALDGAERDGAMAVIAVHDSGAFADGAARAALLAAAAARGIRNVAVELVDDDGAAPRLPRD